MDRKEEILEIATELVQTHGYSAFSYNDLSERLGISKASIHHHFASKADLGLAVAEKCLHDIAAALTASKQASSDPWKQLEGYFAIVSSDIKSQERICPAGSTQADINVVPEPMAKKMVELVQYIVSWVSDIIKDGREQGVMNFSGTPREQAELIFSAAQGAMQYGRANGEKRGQGVLRQIKNMMKPER